MRLVRLVLINIRRQLKNPSMVLMTLIFPIFMILIMNSGSLSYESGSIGIIDNNNSKYSRQLIERLEKEYDIETLDGEVEKSYKLLMEKKLGAIYVIGSDFEQGLENGEIPNIKCYRTESASGSIMAEDIIKSYVSEFLQEGVSKGLSINSTVAVIVDKDVDIKADYKMTVIMICYFMMIGGSIVAGEIIKLKDQKVLKRTIATSNSDSAILGSIFISSFIIQGILGSLAFIILTIILKSPTENILQGVLIVFLGSLITTAIITVVTRWIKNLTLASLSTVVFGILSFGLGMFSSELDSFTNIPDVITKISVISPFTWLLRIVDTGKIFIPVLIIVLMSGVLFTAGSFRLREFVKE